MIKKSLNLSLISLAASLCSCSLDPYQRDTSWTPSFSPEKNIQAMLANPDDWNNGRHSEQQVAPLAVDAIQKLRENKVPALPKDSGGYRPSAG